METISFTKQIKEELVALEFTRLIKLSILGALIKNGASYRFEKGKTVLSFKTENAHVAKFIYQIIKSINDEAKVSFSYRKKMKLYKTTEYLVNLTSEVEKILEELNIDLLDYKIPYNLTNKEEKIKGYFLGLFLMSGSCNSPNSSNYHLEISCSNEEDAKNILKLIAKNKIYSFDFKMIKRRSQYIVYLKKSDQIASFLAYIDANYSCLEFENIRLDRDYANINNRLINCDTYNYKKTIQKAYQQLETIKLIDEKLGIKNIANEKVKALCLLRIEHPEATYLELAELLGEALSAKVSKSNINHLFIKINEIAEGIMYGRHN